MNFLKKTILTGLYLLLPILLLWIGAREISSLLAAMAGPIADMFPSEYFDELKWPGIVAALLIAAASFVIGVFAQLDFVSRLAVMFERNVLFRIPMYRMLKIVSSSLVAGDKSDLRPAIIKDNAGGGDPCYVMERPGTGMATVLLPWSPASFAGSIKVVPESRLRILDCTVDEYSRSISFMGIGIAECLAKSGSSEN